MLQKIWFHKSLNDLFQKYYQSEIFNSLNIIGALTKFEKNKEFKIVKTYLQNKKKIKLNYIK